jgi:hypothetical protein
MLATLLAGQSFPPMTQALIVLGVGAFSTLLGFGLLPAGLDQKKAAAWRKRNARNFRIGGPLVILVGLVLLVRAMIWPF